MKLLILLEDDEQNEWYGFAGKELSAAFSDIEPTYELNMLKEPNPDY